MDKLLRLPVFENDSGSLSRQLLLAWLFFPFTLLALALDSPYFESHYFDGRLIVNILVITFFAWQFQAAGSRLRKVMSGMLFLSWLGEVILCSWLEMYHYKGEGIPLYVPFGHAIVYASGYTFSETTWVKSRDNALRKLFVVSFILLFALCGYLLNDPLTVALGLMFFALLKRKKWQNLYFCIAVCVVFIELAGTWFQCWTWVPKALDRIPTANPPMGAVFFYAAGDVMLARFAAWWEKRNKKGKPCLS